VVVQGVRGTATDVEGGYRGNFTMVQGVREMVVGVFECVCGGSGGQLWWFR
jgi:hypothetical protein